MANISYPIGQILGREDSTQAFLVIDDQDTVRSFGSTELACFGDSDVLRNSEGGRGTKRGDGSFLGSRFGWTFLTGGYTGCRNGAFAGQFGLNFLANGLDRTGDISFPQARHSGREGRWRGAGER